MALEVGQTAPDFTLPVTGEREIRLSDLKGQKVVLYFYPKDDTSGCTAEAQDFQRLKGAFAEAATDVIGVSPDSLKKHANFRKKHGLTTPLAADESREAIEAYGVWGEKTMFGRKYMGVIRSTFLIGPNGKIARIWRNVRVSGHAEEVLESAKAL